jgi:hypothetical protein
MPENDANLVAAACTRIYPILSGLGPDIVPAVLADLTAMWLANWQGNDATKVKKMREQMLTEYVSLVRKLVPINEAIIRGGPLQ